MITPNIEELMALADRYATLRIGEGTANARKELHDAMQSQAARIKELEADRETALAPLQIALDEVSRLRAQLAELVEALEKLARLGNGDQYGSSDILKDTL